MNLLLMWDDKMEMPIKLD